MSRSISSTLLKSLGTADNNSAVAVDMKLCQGKDVLERMNYLYQASHLMALQSKNAIAASYYGNVMVGCAKKAVLRMNPDVKRTVCKSCQLPLIPGETARVRLASKPTKMVKWTCLTCNSIKKFPTKKGHKLWAEQPEALVEFFDYTPKPKEVISVNQSERTEGLIKPPESIPASMDCEISNTNDTFVQNKENNTSEKGTNVNRDVENILRLDKDVKGEFSMITD